MMSTYRPLLVFSSNTLTASAASQSSSQSCNPQRISTHDLQRSKQSRPNDDVVGRTALTLTQPCGRNAGGFPVLTIRCAQKRYFDFFLSVGRLSVRPFPTIRFAVFSHHLLAPDAPLTRSPELQTPSSILLSAPPFHSRTPLDPPNGYSSAIIDDPWRTHWRRG